MSSNEQEKLRVRAVIIEFYRKLPVKVVDHILDKGGMIELSKRLKDQNIMTSHSILSRELTFLGKGKLVGARKLADFLANEMRNSLEELFPKSEFSYTTEEIKKPKRLMSSPPVNVAALDEPCAPRLPTERMPGCLLRHPDLCALIESHHKNYQAIVETLPVHARITAQQLSEFMNNERPMIVGQKYTPEFCAIHRLINDWRRDWGKNPLSMQELVPQSRDILLQTLVHT